MDRGRELAQLVSSLQSVRQQNVALSSRVSEGAKAQQQILLLTAEVRLSLCILSSSTLSVYVCQSVCLSCERACLHILCCVVFISVIVYVCDRRQSCY